MVRLGNRGVSDIVVVVGMFILVVVSTVLIMGYSPSSLEASSHRQDELRVNYLYRSLSEVEVRPGTSSLEAVAEQITVRNPSVENDYLKSWMENTLNFLRPKNFGVKLRVRRENKAWIVKIPDEGDRGENFIFRGTFAYTRADGNFIETNVLLCVFKIESNSAE